MSVVAPHDLNFPVLCLSRDSGCLLREEVSPYEGARAIWSEACDPLGGGRLIVLKALASGHEDYRFSLKSRLLRGRMLRVLRGCERRILEEAAALSSEAGAWHLLNIWRPYAHLDRVRSRWAARGFRFPG